MLNRNEFMGAVARAGYTCGRLANNIGMSKNTLSAKANGKGFFNTDQIDKMCDVLKIDDDLIKAQIFLAKSSQNKDELQ